VEPVDLAALYLAGFFVALGDFAGEKRFWNHVVDVESVEDDDLEQIVAALTYPVFLPLFTLIAVRRVAKILWREP